MSYSQRVGGLSSVIHTWGLISCGFPNQFFSGVFIWNLLSLVVAFIGMFGSIFVYMTHKQDYILKMQALFTRLDFGFVHPELKKSTIT